jgi:hypothetical protein
MISGSYLAPLSFGEGSGGEDKQPKNDVSTR